ncbi:flavin prenyltransferase UbiX [Aliidiomarina quisquiliarum]|uniref:flavin prenyltransferase UbiX n=1 Tax=Aliidiomarina quisquiliarum TaxID=2938947 RepID=UPI00208FEAC0|nr:flavin prenyltransferase UbiX [Aliidiomarina quisquiliarum]MCO4322600.1 UbiX family flavin prenyltransferase [Aliidiomarina quisquiliarum]
MKRNDARITLAITGASGAPYALRLLECLVAQKQQVMVLISSAAKVVFATEENIQIPSGTERAAEFLRTRLQQQGVEVAEEQIQVFGKQEWFSPVASGSAAPKRMVICPCSTGTLSAVATGASDNLIERAADVVLKERGQLILVPREMPLHAIHLEHMLKLAQMGATIMPASPGFYHQPQSIDDLINFVVARILDHLDLDQSLIGRWGYTLAQPQIGKEL